MKPSILKSIYRTFGRASMSLAQNITCVPKGFTAQNIHRSLHVKVPPKRDGTWSVIAYNLSEELKIDKVHSFLEKFKEYQLVEMPEDLQAEAVMLSLKQSTSPASLHDVFLFREGSIVFWGVPYEQQKRILYNIATMKVDPHSNELIREEIEQFNYTLVDSKEKSRLSRETLQLSTGQDKHLDQFTLSHAVSLSVKLGIWEAVLDKYIESVGWLTSSMKRGEKLPLTREQVFSKTGELYELKHCINLSSDLLDLPDIYWDRYDQEVLFLSLVSFLNLRRRTTVINEKLNNCCELMNLLANHINDKHHVRLEWMIIALIMIEVLFELLRFWREKVPETMFSLMLKDHQRAQEELKSEINNKRVIAEKAVDSLTSRSVKHLNDGIAQAYLNQHKLDNEARKLQSNVAKLTKQAQQWMVVCNSLNNAVKDLGDISTWTKTIENDVKFIAKAVEDSYSDN